MTREEQIKKQSDNYSDNRNNYTEWSDYWQELNDIEYVERAFEAGAKWADENPKKGLVSIDKACDWFRKDVLYVNNDYFGDPRVMALGYEKIENFITDFRKAMEE